MAACRIWIGVATANLAGRTLADLILRRGSDLVRLPWVGHRSPRWEPEPLRYLAVNATRRAMVAADGGRLVWWRQADGMALPFGAAEFDVVCCQFGAMFFPDRVKAYGEVKRVLKPDGCLLISTPNKLFYSDRQNYSNPFHLKDFQGAFSTIDPAVVSAMHVYTGGFPVAFGDRMSGVVDIDPLMPDAPAYRELSLSFFNSSALISECS